MVEPLPLVPAIWIVGGSCCSGCPSEPRMRRIRSSERSINFGCSDVRRATMESIGVMQLFFSVADWPVTAGHAATGLARARIHNPYPLNEARPAQDGKSGEMDRGSRRAHTDGTRRWQQPANCRRAAWPV